MDKYRYTTTAIVIVVSSLSYAGCILSMPLLMEHNLLIPLLFLAVVLVVICVVQIARMEHRKQNNDDK